jgi:hypothetical protein
MNRNVRLLLSKSIAGAVLLVSSSSCFCIDYSDIQQKTKDLRETIAHLQKKGKENAPIDLDPISMDWTSRNYSASTSLGANFQLHSDGSLDVTYSIPNALGYTKLLTPGFGPAIEIAPKNDYLAVGISYGIPFLNVSVTCVLSCDDQSRIGHLVLSAQAGQMVLSVESNEQLFTPSRDPLFEALALTFIISEFLKPKRFRLLKGL